MLVISVGLREIPILILAAGNGYRHVRWPPLCGRLCNSSVHCHTLPTISITPNGSLHGDGHPHRSEAPVYAPYPAWVPAQSYRRCPMGNQADLRVPAPRGREPIAVPHGKARPSLPCAANCHSHSWGSRLPAHFAYSRASSIEIQVTGFLAHPSG